MTTPESLPPNSQPARDVLTGYEADGIQQYDNPLPTWWKWTFIALIAFLFPYFAYYHAGATGRSTVDAYEVASAENARLQFAEIGQLRPDRPTLVKFSHDAKWAAVGRSIYKANCVPCHGADGGGLVGPNLADDYFKNVRSIEDVYKVVTHGAAAGAMPPWQNRLDENERILVSSYVASLRGTTPGGSPRGPEGNQIPPWPTLEEVQAEAAAEAALQEESPTETPPTDAASAEAPAAESPAAEPAAGA